MRTIDELDQSDQLSKLYCNVSDVLAFCIVAGDWLRAKRRRYPLSIIIRVGEVLPEENMQDDTTYNNTKILSVSVRVSYVYFIVESSTFINTILWDYSKEYCEDD